MVETMPSKMHEKSVQTYQSPVFNEEIFEHANRSSHSDDGDSNSFKGDTDDEILDEDSIVRELELEGHPREVKIVKERVSLN